MPKPEGVDLHLHSTASDGSWPPSAIIRQAVRVEVATLALTDHDSIGGIARAQEAARGTGVTVIPGVEVTAPFPGGECHLLGFFAALPPPEFQSFLADRRAARRRRGEEMVARLSALGCSLSEGELDLNSSEVAWGRPHLAAALAAQGFVSTPEEAFQQYLGRGGPAYVPHEPFPPEAGIRRIREARGVPVLAHPVLYGAERWLPRLVEQGLMGLECYHPQHSPPVVDYFLRQTRRYGLLVTGGSDSHGPGPPGLGSAPVPPGVATALRDALAQV